MSLFSLLSFLSSRVQEDRKGLQESLGADAEQLKELQTQIEDLKTQALKAKQERLAEFKTKKKNLIAKSKFEGGNLSLFLFTFPVAADDVALFEWMERSWKQKRER